METAVIIIALGVLIVFSHVLNSLFSKTRIPSVFWLMIIGLTIGPIFKLVLPEQIGEVGNVFTTVTLICILFESGTGLSFQTLGKSIGGASFLTSLNFLGMMVICTPIGHYLLDLDWLHSLYLGAALGGTSSAIVIPMLSQLKPGVKANTILLLESTLSDVLCLAVALAIMAGIQSGDISIGTAALSTLYSIIFAIAGGMAVGLVWLIVLKKFLTGMEHSMFTSFALAFIIYGICDLAGWNGGLAVLSYGLALGNFGNLRIVKHWFKDGEETSINQNERDFFGEIVFVLQTYFFVYIGVCIQLKNPWHLLIGVAIVALTFLYRTVSTGALGKNDLDRRDRHLITSLGAKGLIAAVLATVPLQSAMKLSDNAGLDSMTVMEAVNLKMQDEKPFTTVATDYYQQASPDGQTSNLTDGKTYDDIIDMVYEGQTVRNVAYAVVLFSIILSCALVIIGERKKDFAPAK